MSPLRQETLWDCFRKLNNSEQLYFILAKIIVDLDKLDLMGLTPDGETLVSFDVPRYSISLVFFSLFSTNKNVCLIFLLEAFSSLGNFMWIGLLIYSFEISIISGGNVALQNIF